jgi:hypothetical protein
MEDLKLLQSIFHFILRIEDGGSLSTVRKRGEGRFLKMIGTGLTEFISRLHKTGLREPSSLTGSQVAMPQSRMMG